MLVFFSCASQTTADHGLRACLFQAQSPVLRSRDMLSRPAGRLYATTSVDAIVRFVCVWINRLFTCFPKNCCNETSDDVLRTPTAAPNGQRTKTNMVKAGQRLPSAGTYPENVKFEMTVARFCAIRPPATYTQDQARGHPKNRINRKCNQQP